MTGKILPYEGFWTRAEVEANPKCLYVFGDNLEDKESGYVPSTTQAVIRGLKNAFSIITKMDRKLSPNSFISDSYYLEYSSYLQDRCASLHSYLEWGYTVYVPMKDGELLLGTGKAQMPERAPLCYQMLCKWFKKLFDEFGDKDNG